MPYHAPIATCSLLQITYSFLMVTLGMGLDEKHAFLLVARRVLALAGFIHP